MGGDSGQSQQKAITNTALGTEQQYLTMAQNSMAQGQNLIAPLEQYNTGIINSATSGDESALISAAGPQITNITKLANQAKEAAYNMPAGAGRDAALAEGKLNEGTNIATAFNQLFQNALTSNATLGAGTEAVGLQETGASLNALGTASTSNQALMQSEEAGKSSTMSFLGSLAGVGGQLGAAAIRGPAAAATGG
jgi:hypothetical protein